MTVITQRQLTYKKKKKYYDSGSIGNSDIAPSIIILALAMPCLKARCKRQLKSK